MNPIYIHKSDSTIFANVEKFLTFNLETELDLTGWQAKFILGWVEKTIDDISTHSFEIVLDAQDTKQLRLGRQYGTIILTDSNGNIKTVTNTIPFEVTTAVVENEYQEIDLTIPESSGVDIKLKVGASTVTSVNGMTGDVVIEMPSLEGYVKNTDYATTNTYGVVKVNTTGLHGVGMNESAGLFVVSATEQQITAKTNSNRVISPKVLDYAVKTGVTTNTIELSADEKANAKAWLGYADSTDIMQAIASIPQFKISIVDELPLAGEKMTLYLVPKEGTNNDVYDEYIWIEQTTSFEHLGTTAVDLTDYVKNTDYITSSTAGVVRAGAYYGTTAFNGFLCCQTRTLEQYNAHDNTTVIGKGTLENIKNDLVKRAVTANDIELTDDEKTSARTWLGAIGSTDYAQGSVAGVVKASNTFACGCVNGYIQASNIPTVERYNNLGQYAFIGKGTLETALTQYSKTVLTTEADYEALETKDANTLYLIEE